MRRTRPKVLELCAVDFTVRQFLVPLVFHLEDHGCDVHVACSKGPYWDELVEKGIRMVEMPISRSRDLRSHLRSTWRIAEWIIRNKPDVVHVHTPVASLVGRLAARICDVPVLIYTAHGFYFHELMPPKEYRLHAWIEYMFSALQTHLFCVSEEDVQTAIRLGIARPQDVTYIGNGIDSRRFNPDRPESREARFALRDELGIPRSAPVVTSMGRMVREKGWLDLLEGARPLLERHHALHLILAGDTVTADRDGVKEEVERLIAGEPYKGRVHLIGMRDDVPSVLMATDVFCLPSYREGLSTSVLEAMMMARPVVAYRIRGCRESIVDGQTGFLVSPGSPADLTGAIDYLLRNPSVGIAMGQAGRRRALARYELANVLRREWTAMVQILSAAHR